MTLEEVEREIEINERQLRPLEERRTSLEATRRRLLSLQFIKINGVTEDNLQRSHGDDIPYFGEVSRFIKWMKESNCKKRFCEWNGAILFTAELMAGSCSLNGIGRVHDMPEYSAVQ